MVDWNGYEVQIVTPRAKFEIATDTVVSNPVLNATSAALPMPLAQLVVANRD